jgi:hypothetical protein
MCELAAICPLSAISRHMQCSKQPVNLGALGQALGLLTDYNLAPADENDLSVLRNIAPSHHGYIVEINPNGLCFEIAALHPRCHSRKLSLPGMILLPSQIAWVRSRREQRDEFPSFQLRDHSITRSARTSTEDGIVIPNSLATFWFTVSSKRVGCMIGSSAGFAPWTTLSTYKGDPPGGVLETFAVAHECSILDNSR